MAIREITDAEFKETIEDSPGVSILDFWAPWCGPCRQLAPIMEKLSDEFADNINFYSMDVDQNVETPARFSVTGIPTLRVFKDGKEVGSLVGARPYAALKQEFEKIL